MSRPRSSEALNWLVTVRAGGAVVSAWPCPNVRAAIGLAVIVRRFWPGLRVTVRRYPRAYALTLVRAHGRAYARHVVSGGRAA